MSNRRCIFRRPAGGLPPAAFCRLLLLAAALLLYWPATDHGFINFDDPDYVLENGQVRQGLTMAGLKWAFTTTHAGNWHPLTWLSHMADVALFGMRPAGHHFTSILIHAVTGVLIFQLFLRATGHLWLAALLAAVVTFHPLQVESVAWVAERKNVLAGLFGVLTLFGYTAYARRPGWRLYGVTLVLFALGLMAKPMLVTLPFVMVLFDFWPLGRASQAGIPGLAGLWPLIREKWPFFILSAVSAAVTILAQSSGKAIQSLDAIPFGVRLVNALASYGAYIGKLIWPVNLGIYYPYAGSPAPAAVALAAALLVAFSAVALAFRGSRPFLPVGWLWFLGTLVPVIGLVQVGFQAMADRYAAIPMIGLWIMFIWGAKSIIGPRLKPLAVGAAGLALIGLSLATGRQLAYWRDSITLYTHTLAAAGSSAPIHLNLGIALVEKGAVTEAMINYLKVIAINPRHAAAHYNLGLALVKTGQADQALLFFDRAVKLSPQLAEARVGKAAALAEQGHADQAVSELKQALAIDPQLVTAHLTLANLLADQGRADEATAHLETAVAIAPWNAAARNNLGLLLARQGRLAEASAHYAEAIAADPVFVEAHINLAVCLMRLGQFEAARRHLDRALRIDPFSAEAKANRQALEQAMRGQ